MLHSFSHFYSKYGFLLIILLIVLNFIFLFNSGILLSFFSTINKFIPESLVNYFINNQINSSDWLNIFVISTAVTGVTAIWRKYYLEYYIGKVLKLNINNSRKRIEPIRIPNFHMMSIHSFFSNMTTIIVLVYLLILNAGIVPIQPTIKYIFNLLKAEFFIIPFFLIGLFSIVIQCLKLLYGFLGTASRTIEKSDEK